MRYTVNVVIKGDKPVYASDDREQAQELARELDEEWGENVELWKNVSCDMEGVSDE